MPFVPTEPMNDEPVYMPPPLTPESRAIAVVHKWQEGKTTLGELCTVVQRQIEIALAVKDERILALVRQWERAYLNHDRQGEHNAVRLIARECGGDLEDFTGIPAYE